MTTAEEITNVLSEPSRRPTYETIEIQLDGLKEIAVEAGQEEEAKRIWNLETVSAIQANYWQAFDHLKNGKFYQAWCVLEQVELAIERLRRHARNYWEEDLFDLRRIESMTRSLQSLFPYRIFLSPEFVILESKCNICDAVHSIRGTCGHKKGEIYRGVHCSRVITKSRIIGQAFVNNPVQKYSVPFTVNKDGETIDHYNYSTVSYVADRWPTPFHEWSVTKTTALHPKHRFGPLGRNDKCPCESDLKYKNCCMRREGIQRPHFEFAFSYSLPKHLQTIEFSE